MGETKAGSYRNEVERALAEKALQMQAQLAAIVESSDDAIIGKDLNELIVSWNPGAERLYGYSADEVKGKPIDILMPPDRPNELPRIMEKLKRGERIDHHDTERIRKDGQRICVSVSISPIRDASGKVTGAVASSRDITERKRAQEAQRFLAQASVLLGSSLDGEATLASLARLAVPHLADWCSVDLVEEDGSVRQVAVAHVDPAKVEPGRELERRCPTEPRAPFGVPNVLRTGQSELYPEIPYTPLASTARDAAHLKMLRDLGSRSAMIVPLVARGRTLGAISFVSSRCGRSYGPADLALAEDLAQRAALAVDNARLYQEVQKAVSIRDEFLSVAAHELRTPVTSLHGFAQLTLRQLDREGTLDTERLRNALRVIGEQSGKLAQLVSRLLDLSGIESGRLALERTITDITDMVENVVALARANTDQHTLVVHAPVGVQAVVDPLRLEQVLTNLIDNAIKYSPDGGSIEVAVTRPDPETVRLAVTDQGIGIPPEHRQQIFDRFYQAQAGQRSRGIGLGLYVSHQIVTLHGGRLEAEFPSEGGTRFVVSLPVGLGDAAGHSEPGIL